MKHLLRLFFLAVPFVVATTAYAQAGPTELNQPYRLLSKPKPAYTDSARKKELEGHVILKVTLLASGQIGPITNVTKKKAKKLLKYGLVDAAIEAARKIQFTPKIVNGVPVSVVVTFDYEFSVY